MQIKFSIETKTQIHEQVELIIMKLADENPAVTDIFFYSIFCYNHQELYFDMNGGTVTEFLTNVAKIAAEVEKQYGTAKI